MEETKSLIRDLIVKDLNLKEAQFEVTEELSILDGSAICIVHELWLKAAQQGNELPSETPKLSPHHLHWLMQPSCSDDRVPDDWYLVRTFCVNKGGISSKDNSRVLSAPRRKWTVDGFSSFLSQITCENQQLSWRQFVGDISSHSTLLRQKPLNEVFIRQVIKDLYGTDIIKIGSCNHNKGEGLQFGYSNLCSPNLSPLLCALESDQAFYFIVPHCRHTLFDLVTHSPCAIGSSSNKPLFVLYQLLQLLNSCHDKGVSLGEFGLRDINIDDRLWVSVMSPLSSLSHESFEVHSDEAPLIQEVATSCAATDKILLPDALHLWQNGALSNLDYLLCLNHHVGRKFEEPNNHPVVPWVTDFTSPNYGYRDLSKSKHRLNKGDQQLDFTYVNAKEQLRAHPHVDSVYPHHVGDLLSDVTYYMYLARRTPKELLCSRVRPRWVPGEYPSSIKKLYDWTPDECIPEFYTDSEIFCSIHDDLSDLGVPPWCSSVEEFVRHHRSILESDYVSANLHHWIDITFGYKLQGEAAVKAKNVHLTLVDGHTSVCNHGIVQLFNTAHPKKTALSSAPYSIKRPLYNPFGSLQYGIVSNSRDDMISLETQGDTDQRIKRTMSRKELQEHLEQPGVIVDDQLNTTPPSVEFSDEYGFLDVSVHYPEIMSDRVSISQERKSKDTLLSLSLWSQRPKISRMLQRKPGIEEAPVFEYPWQNAAIQLPKDFVPMQNVTEVEETGLFVYKAVGDGASSVQDVKWSKDDFCGHNVSVKRHGLLGILEKKYQHYQLSFEEQVAVDLFSGLCTVIEMCCADQLRAMMPQGASLLQRLSLLIKLHKSKVLNVPNFLCKAVSNYFTDTFSLTGETSQGLPGLSAPLILQQCIPVVCFPSNFQFLYSKLSELNHFYQLLFHSPVNDNCKLVNELSDYLSNNVSVTILSLDDESLHLLILHLMPYFMNSLTSFETVMTSFDNLAKYLNRDEIIRVFSPLLQSLYDQNSLEPHQKAQILHRPFLNIMIRHVGLSHFLDRFIYHVVEAVINPSGIHSRKEQRKGQNLTLRDDQFHVAKEEQPMGTGEAKQLSLLVDMEPDYSSEEEDLIGDDYTSLLAQTPIQSTPKQLPGNKPVKGERTYSQCSLDDVISMEPILVVSPPVDSKLVTDEDAGIKDDTLTQNAQLSPDNRTSPDADDSFSELAAADVTLAPPSNYSISAEQIPSHNQTTEVAYKDNHYDDEDREEEDDDIGSVELSQYDKMLAEVAMDSLQWLIHRLGPLLATKYIIRPLLDGMYRCFTSHYSNQEVAVLKCLSHFVSTYGPIIVSKLYLPHAETLIDAAKRQLQHKSEGGLMASLAILQLCFEYMSEKTLQDNMNNYCSEIFHPIAQFICSSSYVFTTGWKLRLQLCHLFIGTLSFVGKKLGREGALHHLTGVLQLFFAGFDVVYGVGLVQHDNSLLVNTTAPTDVPCQVTVEDVDNPVPLVNEELLSATPSKLARNLGSHLGDDKESRENFMPIEQLCKVFTPKLAHSAYVTMCLVLGQLNLRRELYNTELVEQITYTHDEAIQALTAFPQPAHFVSPTCSSDISGYTSYDSEDDCDISTSTLGPFLNANKGLSFDETDYGRSSWFVDLLDAKEKPHKTVSSGHLVSLNQPDSVNDVLLDSSATLNMYSAAFETKFGGLACDDLLTDVSDKQLSKGHSSRKLKTMWAGLWETRCQNMRSPYKFHNIKLQTYIGHKAAVKGFCVPDDEQFLFSASKDRTVKIWSLHNRGDEMEMYQCQRTYSEHQRPLLAVQYVQNLKQVVSCDSTVHLWDAETGYLIRQVSSATPGTTFTAMALIPFAFQPLVALGTSDSQLQLMDIRSKALVHKWKVLKLEPSGVVKCITCDEHLKWLAIGSNNDIIATLDPSTGEVLSSWKTAESSAGVWKPYAYSHETDTILQLKATRRGLLISSNGNGVTSLWRPKAGGLVHHIKVGSPSLHCLDVYKDHLVAINGNNQVFVYHSYEFYNQAASPAQHKWQSKVLKGNISAMTLLPNNQTVLIGSDTGQIALMA